MTKIEQPESLMETARYLKEHSGEVLWFRVGTLISGRLEEPIRGANFVFSEKEILHVGVKDPPATVLPFPKEEPDLVLPDVYLMPGLIEAHAHLFLEGGETDFERRSEHLKKTPQLLLEEAELRLENLLKTGVCGVRDAGDKDGVGLALSRARKAGPYGKAPYIDSPGAAIHKEGRYGSFMGEAIESCGGLETAVQARVNSGADRIKLIPTGIINFKKGMVTARPQLSVEELTALRTCAERLNRRTFAHASGEEGIGNAIEAGIHSIEHGFFMSGEQIRMLADKGLAWVPTFSPVHKQLQFADKFGWSAEVQDHLKRILEGHATLLNEAIRLGANIVTGSDAGSCAVAHGIGLLEELELMESAGMPAREVIHSATGRSSDVIGYEEPMGFLKAGYRPNFLILNENPLERVAHLRGEKVIHRNGFNYHAMPDEVVPGL